MSIRNCHECRDWTKCSGYSYFVPSEIDDRYCWSQVMFLVLAREQLACMAWPEETSGYVDQPGKPQPASHAPFEGSTAIVCVVFGKRLSMVEVSSIGREHLAKLDKELLQGRKFSQLGWEASQVVQYLIKTRREAYRLWLKGRKR
jgi:hypothetical protein